MTERETCPDCDGVGRIPWADSYRTPQGRWVDDAGSFQCDTCEGTGEVSTHINSDMQLEMFR